ncbi:MAG: NADH-quinone oxidoreductase subunit A [Pirellulales bacterium]|nr:NADH-quinone oxidoreductase subunit A [Pirellulales bacterium]
MATPTAIVAYLALFALVAALFLFVNLLVGRLVRPKLPNTEKLEVYECGEPVIGSSFVQFDLRFYVVALLFIIFDVEIAFFFPWATVFGKTVQLSSPQMQLVTETDGSEALTPEAVIRLQELGIANPELSHFVATDDSPGGESVTANLRNTAQKMALTSMADIGAFFAVLLVGFAYVWKRGDLDWVRAVSSQEGDVVARGPPQASLPTPRPARSIIDAGAVG